MQGMTAHYGGRSLACQHCHCCYCGRNVLAPHTSSRPRSQCYANPQRCQNRACLPAWPALPSLSRSLVTGPLPLASNAPHNARKSCALTAARLHLLSMCSPPSPHCRGMPCNLCSAARKRCSKTPAPPMRPHAPLAHNKATTLDRQLHCLIAQLNRYRGMRRYSWRRGAATNARPTLKLVCAPRCWRADRDRFACYA